MMLPHRRDTLFRPKRPLPIGTTRPKSAIFPRAEGHRSKKGEIFAPYTKKSVSLCDAHKQVRVERRILRNYTSDDCSFLGAALCGDRSPCLRRGCGGGSKTVNAAKGRKVGRREQDNLTIASKNFNKLDIAIIGTGYVGLVSGACFAEMGATVSCIDIDRRKIERLCRGEVPIYEPGLQEIIERNVAAGRLRFSTSLEECISQVQITSAT